jgi:transporter family protein
MNTAPTWLLWALGSAVFAALTAIFAKIGLRGVDSDSPP